MSRHTGQDDLNSAGRRWGSTGLLVLAIAALVLIVLGQNMAGIPVDVSQNAHVPASSSVSVSHPELVLNNDGSATLSASLATTGKEAALEGVQIVYRGSAQEVSSTEMWLPVIPGVDATVGAASDAGGFTVASGLKAGDVADVYFVFDDRTCVNVEAEVVQRTALHGSVFPKWGSQLGPARRPPDSLTSTCSDPVKSARLAQEPDPRLLTAGPMATI